MKPSHALQPAGAVLCNHCCPRLSASVSPTAISEGRILGDETQLAESTPSVSFLGRKRHLEEKAKREGRLEMDINKNDTEEIVASDGDNTIYTQVLNILTNIGLDPVSWTSSERWIRWPEWDQSRQGDERDDSSLRSSWSARSGWCLDEGKTIGAVARELDLTPSALGNWVRPARADRSQGKTG